MKKNKNLIFVFLIILLIVAVFIVMIIGGNSKSVIQTPTSEEISQIIQDKNITIIDVRTKEEYESGHIKGAINIPDTEIENEVNYDKDKAIAVYCRTGVRSSEAAKTLEKMGYTKIYDLGGIKNMNIELTTD